MNLTFWKMQALRNDFVLVHNPPAGWPDAETVRRLGDRRTGVGFDQLLVVTTPATDDCDAAYRVFNADGSEVEQCGNGARCIARWVAERFGLTGELRLMSPIGPLRARLVAPDRVRLEMGVPRLAPDEVPLRAARSATRYQLLLPAGSVEFSALSMGNPHAVVVVPAVDRAPVESVGAQLGTHADFPQGANVGFLEVVDREHVRLRVHERGVGETPACGSGACAAVVAGVRLGLLGDAVEVTQPGGSLQIEWEGPGHVVWMTGEAIHVFEGKLTI